MKFLILIFSIWKHIIMPYYLITFYIFQENLTFYLYEVFCVLLRISFTHIMCLDQAHSYFLSPIPPLSLPPQFPSKLVSVSSVCMGVGTPAGVWVAPQEAHA